MPVAVCASSNSVAVVAAARVSDPLLEHAGIDALDLAARARNSARRGARAMPSPRSRAKNASSVVAQRLCGSARPPTPDRACGPAVNATSKSR